MKRSSRKTMFALVERLVYAVENDDDRLFAKSYAQLRHYCENLHDDYPAAWEALATWTLDPQESLRYFEIALGQLRKQTFANDPSLPHILFHVGRLALETGNLKSARKHLAEAHQEALRQHKVYLGAGAGEEMLQLEQRSASLLLQIHLANSQTRRKRRG